MMVQAASFEGTTDVPVSQRLDETALRHWMTTELGADPGPLRISKFAGGQSREIDREIRTLDGKSPLGDWKPAVA